MIRWLAILLLVGCSPTTWRSVDPDQIEDEHVLVVTDQHAYEMNARHVDGKVEGRPRRAWTTTECEIDDIDESPSAIAKRCAWAPYAAPQGVRIDDNAIVDVHVERGAASQPLRVLVGAAIAVTAVALTVGVVASLPPPQTH